MAGQGGGGIAQAVWGTHGTVISWFISSLFGGINLDEWPEKDWAQAVGGTHDTIITTSSLLGEFGWLAVRD